MSKTPVIRFAGTADTTAVGRAIARLKSTYPYLEDPMNLDKVLEQARLVSQWHGAMNTGPLEELDAELGLLSSLLTQNAKEPWRDELTLTQERIALADHDVRCLPYATEEQWCFHKHTEYANELWHVLQGTPKVEN